MQKLVWLNPILRLESIDIDTESDWDFALLTAKYLQNTKSVYSVVPHHH